MSNYYEDLHLFLQMLFILSVFSIYMMRFMKKTDIYVYTHNPRLDISGNSERDC